MTIPPPLRHLRTVKFIPTIEPESICNQGWDVHIVSFGQAASPGVDHFNTGFVHAWGRDWLITRRSEYDPKIRIGHNSMMAFGLTDFKPMVGYKLRPHTIAQGKEHHEDPRAIFDGEHAWISCCNYVWDAANNLWSGAHQAIFKFDKNWMCVQRFDPIYGNNIDKFPAVLGPEKNWLWFFHQGEIHMVYRTHPHAVVVFDKQLKYLRETASEWDNSGWRYGQMRGGTPPVLHGGLYWSFFHSSIDKGAGEKRRYYMGAYCFEAKPPFKVVGYTEKPLLIGSKKDRWAIAKPACIFCVGAAIRDGTWIITGGVNDFDTFLGKFPHAEIERRVIRI